MKTKLIIHHSADPSTGPQFEKINAYHRSEGFPISSLGFHCGYTWVDEYDGTLRQARGLEDYGAHTLAICDEEACNLVAYGVCLAGDFTWQKPSDAQLQTLYELWKNLNYPKIITHSDVKGTSCPGDYDFRNDMTRRHLKYLAQQLKNAIRALPRWIGTIRGRMLERKIKRLEDLEDII